MKNITVVIKSIFPDYREKMMKNLHLIVKENWNTLYTGAMRLEEKDVVLPYVVEKVEYIPGNYYAPSRISVSDDGHQILRLHPSDGVKISGGWHIRHTDRAPRVSEIEDAVRIINVLFTAAAEPLKEEISIKVIRRKAGAKKTEE